MTFKEFMALDELDGLYGKIKAASGNLPSIYQQIKLTKPVKAKGTSVSRLMSAGKVKNPARPVGIVSPMKPMTVPSVIG